VRKFFYFFCVLLFRGTKRRAGHDVHVETLFFFLWKICAMMSVHFLQTMMMSVVVNTVRLPVRFGFLIFAIIILTLFKLIRPQMDLCRRKSPLAPHGGSNAQDVPTNARPVS